MKIDPKELNKAKANNNALSDNEAEKLNDELYLRVKNQKADLDKHKMHIKDVIMSEEQHEFDELKLKDENTIAISPMNAITRTNGTNCLESNFILKVRAFYTLSPKLMP